MTQGHDHDALRWVIEDLAYHQARVLLLVAAVASDPGHQRKLDGLTKLAKLDFLVRYPALASVVLDDLDGDEPKMHLSDHEVAAPTEVEDPMTRYKYGPWDDRYYPVVGALVSRGLLKYVKGRRGSVALTTTPAGKKFADDLTHDPLWTQIADRCEAVAEASAGLTGNALKERIYERLADLMDRPHRNVIS
ncbi:MAG: hypothetical protein JWR37_5694 [Mycobacterium sp.]|nr:hypothetical protein [Mycobacterium sp.]